LAHPILSPPIAAINPEGYTPQWFVSGSTGIGTISDSFSSAVENLLGFVRLE